MIQAGDLRCRIQLYELEEVRNVLGERTMEYRPGRKVWAQIVPTSGRSVPQAGEVEPMEVTHRVVVRSTALPELRNGLRFTFRGHWYEVLYGYPIYNRTGWLELFARLVVDDAFKSF